MSTLPHQTQILCGQFWSTSAIEQKASAEFGLQRMDLIAVQLAAKRLASISELFGFTSFLNLV